MTKEKTELHLLWLTAGVITLIIGIAAIGLDINTKITGFGILLGIITIICFGEANYIHLKYLGEHPVS